MRPASRRRGVGTALVEAVLGAAEAAGAYKTWVLADADNAAARRTYTGTNGRAAEQVTFTWSAATSGRLIRPS